jgi:hypothetical protein
MSCCSHGAVVQLNLILIYTLLKTFSVEVLSSIELILIS